MEPSIITMTRDINRKAGVVKERYPGDGEEEPYSLDDHIITASTSYRTPSKGTRNTPVKHLSKTKSLDNVKLITKLKTPAKSLDSTKLTLNISDNDISSKIQLNISPELSANDSCDNSYQDLHITIDVLKTKLKLCEEHNSQLIEEKLRLSQQLGVQTQVNNEVKRLLVASVGEDLEEKYERFIQDKTQTDLEVKHLRNVMEEDREEVEQALISADVWRSKFLASRVMNDELARWKSALYYKYRESHTALQSLLEEHSKIRALNNATRRGLISVTELLDCKDPSLDSIASLTTIDVAFMNNDLAEALVEVITGNIERNSECGSVMEMIEIKETVLEKERGRKNINNEIFVEANELTPAEQLAHEVVINTGIQTEELTRMRHDYLAHNRISHFLSTNYHVTFNCCENCKGPVYII